MSRSYEYHRERQPQPSARDWQAYANRKAIEDAEWQYFDELKKNAEGAAAVEADKARQNAEYLEFALSQSNPVKH